MRKTNKVVNIALIFMLIVIWGLLWPTLNGSNLNNNDTSGMTTRKVTLLRPPLTFNQNKFFDFFKREIEQSKSWKEFPQKTKALAFLKDLSESSVHTPGNLRDLEILKGQFPESNTIETIFWILFFNEEIDPYQYIRAISSEKFLKVRDKIEAEFRPRVGKFDYHYSQQAALLLPAYLGEDFWRLDENSPVEYFGDGSGWEKTVFFFECNLEQGSKVKVALNFFVYAPDSRRIKFTAKLCQQFFDVAPLFVTDNIVMATFVEPPAFRKRLSPADLREFSPQQEESFAEVLGVHIRLRFLKKLNLWYYWTDNTVNFLDESDRFRCFSIDLDDHFSEKHFMDPFEKRYSSLDYLEDFSRLTYREGLCLLTALPGWRDAQRRNKLLDIFEASFNKSHSNLNDPRIARQTVETLTNMARFGYPFRTESVWNDRANIESCYRLHVSWDPSRLLEAIYSSIPKEIVYVSQQYCNLRFNKSAVDIAEELDFWKERKDRLTVRNVRGIALLTQSRSAREYI